MRDASLPIRISDGAVIPGFLDEEDLPWLGSLLELVDGHAGCRWRELEAALRRPVSEGAPVRKQALAAGVVRRLLRRRIDAPVAPARVRQVVFGMAAPGGDRPAIVRAAAEALALEPAEIERSLFADLPAERIVVVPRWLPAASTLVEMANQELCRALLMRAIEVDIRVAGASHGLVRRALRRGLLCRIDRAGGDLVRLRVSGPLVLFRRTTRYGHALAGLLPALGECGRFELSATLVVRRQEVRLRLGAGDPVVRSVATLGRSVRRATRRLAAELTATGGWIVACEPDPIEVGSSMLFPDLVVAPQGDPETRWAIEIIGFWTPDYLAAKAAAYRDAGQQRLILCIDERLKCADGDPPTGLRIVRHRGSPSAEEIRDAMGGEVDRGAGR